MSACVCTSRVGRFKLHSQLKSFFAIWFKDSKSHSLFRPSDDFALALLNAFQFSISASDEKLSVSAKHPKQKPRVLEKLTNKREN